MRLKIKSLFLAEVTLSLWASAASATWPRITGSHFTACTLVALLPCYPVCSTFSASAPLLVLHLPFRVLELCCTSQKCHRQSCVASRRQQQPQGNSKATQTRILWQPTTATFAPHHAPHYFFPLSLLPIVNWQ